MKPSYTILVPSCDKFSDLWKPFFTLFFKHWPSLSHPVYLISNEKVYEDPRVISLPVGEDKSWSHNMSQALAQIPTSHVLVILEDFPFLEPVKDSQLESLFHLMVEKKAGYLRLRAAPAPDLPEENTQGVGLLSTQASYRTSLQVAFWEKEVLQSLLIPGESPWDFELKGTIRSRGLSVPFLSLKETTPQPISYFPNGVVRGIWAYDAVQACQAQGVPIDPNLRPIETPMAQWVRRLPFRRWISVFFLQPLRKYLGLSSV